jgi:hypothetical protein
MTTSKANAALHVAQVSQPAVSPISKSAKRRFRWERPRISTVHKFGNLRYIRLGSLRYFEA